MSKAGKIVLYILSFTPIVWTVLILICSYFYYKPKLFRVKDIGGIIYLSDIFFITAYYYVLFGILIWLFTAIYLGYKKYIEMKKILLLGFFLLLGIAIAYLSIYYDIFCVRGCYID